MLVEPLCAVKDCTFFCSKVCNSQIFSCCLLDSDTVWTHFLRSVTNTCITVTRSFGIHWQLLKTLYMRRFFWQGKSLTVARKRWNFIKNKPFSRGTKGAQLTLVLWQDWEVIEEQQHRPGVLCCILSLHTVTFSIWLGGRSHRGRWRGYSSKTPPVLVTPRLGSVCRREISTVEHVTGWREPWWCKQMICGSFCSIRLLSPDPEGRCLYCTVV